MKIYLAGPCDTEHRTLMAHIAERFRRESNIELYCPWEYKVEDAWGMPQEDWAAKVFWADVQAINECDVFLMISIGRKSTAGTNWEQGYAFAKEKVVYVIQITDKSTSLMTFCGCTYFWNTTKDELYKDLGSVINTIFDPTLLIYKYKECRTVLT